MRRYWIDAQDREGDEIIFRADVFHHIVHVCRQEVDSQFEVLPGDGRAYFVKMIEVGKKTARAKILEERKIPPLPLPEIVLAVSLPRFATFDLILEKAAELGVSRVVPFTSDFSFVRDPKMVSGKVERWQKIIRGACQQSGRGQLMNLDAPLPLPEVLRSFSDLQARHPEGFVRGLFPFEGEAGQNIRQALQGERSALKERSGGPGPSQFWIFVGSEGGFSAEEAKLFQRFGLAATTLGSQVLRVETACLALVVIIRYDLGQFAELGNE